MLSCHKCLCRCIRAIYPNIGHVSSSTCLRPSRSSQSRRLLNGQIQRRHASSLQALDRHKKDDGNVITRAVRSHPIDSHRLPDELAIRRNRRMKLEIPWVIGDRMKLLDRTKALLQEGKQDEAVTLVRMASKTEQSCTIAWNAILDNLCGQAKTNEAFKLFNEMKKRGQFPDSYTYSTMFRGLARAPSSHTTAVTRAVTLFQSLSNPNSKVKPNLLLTNAALNVCAKHNDMDAMFSIVPNIPDHGPDAADNATFTTILNAMRYNVQLPEGAEASEEQATAIDATVLQGRQIWEDIIKKWRTAKLVLDENLVNAMGRLLLAGVRPQDWDNILSLVAQTMNIPRQAPHLELRDRSYNGLKLNKPPPPFGQSERTLIGPVDPEAGREFRPTGAQEIWVIPSNKTLTLIMETCQKMFLMRSAQQYWRILTDRNQFGILPDATSFHAYLRLLRQDRASSEALRLVRDEMKECSSRGKTYRIAMSTCLRNSLSPNVMKEASQLMDIMLSRMELADTKACIMWMKLAQESPHPSDTVSALAAVPPQAVGLWNTIKDGSPQEKEDLLALSKAMVSGYDRVMRERAIRDDQISDYTDKKATWTFAVQKLSNPGKSAKRDMSEEELILLERKKKLERFARKEERDKMRVRRSKSSDKSYVSLPPRGEGLPTLEQDV